MTITSTPSALVRALSDRVSGPVSTPASDRYDAERTGFQLLGRHRPSVVVGATGTEDVRAAVAAAADHRLPVAVQAHGHGVGVPLDGGVLIVTGRMAGVRVDPDRRTAWVEAGTPWGAVVRAAAEHGLAPLSGSAPGVGAVPYTLGGGVGLMARRYGFAADHVRLLELVTVDGRVRRVDAEHDPDLFWALRGGGGSFGVATGMEIGLVPVSRIYGGSLFFDAGPDILEAWRAWTRGAPAELSSGMTLLVLPDVPGVPEALRGRHIAQVATAWTGPLDQGPDALAPLCEAAPVLMDTMRELPYAESAAVYAEPDHPHGYRSRSMLLSGLDPAAATELVGRTGPSLPFMSVVGLRHLGGAMAREPETANAVGHRAAAYLLNVLTVAENADTAEGAALRGEAAALFADHTLGRSLNFSFGPLAPEEVREAFAPDDFARLARVKAAVDPDGLVRANHPIPPLA
ncbi:FAD/FMN-containing dehydrogenase [Nocardiopsis sp. Huas11]|uniref:FAD-binding oxidoreductase n=1 Tax=Nocardiopsis sp. Huas11 TaxID=2183912 RepID=UPI000EB31C02|nr:FAD-binding oxidoreductase [Nocardiopsis sp. Huas11]RKS07843.1 FAD/FMN-containing dehydrogenase [Nocardiopsis sp. Huas11]